MYIIFTDSETNGEFSGYIIYMINRESHDGDYDLLYYLLSFVVKRIILIK